MESIQSYNQGGLQVRYNQNIHSNGLLVTVTVLITVETMLTSMMCSCRISFSFFFSLFIVGILSGKAAEFVIVSFLAQMPFFY